MSISAALPSPIASCARKARVALAGGRLRETIYWAAFGYLRPHRFVILRRDLGEPAPPRPATPGVRVEAWSAARVRRWRSGRPGLRLEFFRDEIDGVDTAFVATVGGEVAGLIWRYPSGHVTRFIRIGAGEAQVDYAYLFPECRGHGAFRAILLFACQWLREAGCHTVWATSHAGNGPSIGAALSAGFHDVGRITHFLLFRPRFRTASARPQRVSA